MGTSKSCSYTFEKKSVKLFSNKFWEKSKGFIAITWKLLDRKKKKKKKKKKENDRGPAKQNSVFAK